RAGRPTRPRARRRAPLQRAQSPPPPSPDHRAGTIGPVTDTTALRIGVLLWNQYTDWPSMRDHAARADALGYDSLWTWDHLYPIQGSSNGPILEGYGFLAGWAAATQRATLGLMVGANTFRNPALVVKQITMLDHLSNGRAILGIGAACFDEEHADFGIEFGETVGQRIGWLDEAVDLMAQKLP